MSERRPSRRRLLGAVAAAGLGAAGLSGCDPGDGRPAPAPTPDPLQPLLDEALAMAAAYDRAVAAQPALRARLAPLAADHRAHADELARVIGKPLPSGAASAGPAASPGDPAAPAGDPSTPAGDPSTPAADLAALRRAEQAAQRSAVAACRRAPAARAALIGSIAACRATHAEALR